MGTHVSDRMRSLCLYRSSSSEGVKLFMDALARMVLTPSGFGGRRMNDGRSPFAVDLRALVGDLLGDCGIGCLSLLKLST